MGQIRSKQREKTTQNKNIKKTNTKTTVKIKNDTKNNTKTNTKIKNEFKNEINDKDQISISIPIPIQEVIPQNLLEKKVNENIPVLSILQTLPNLPKLLSYPQCISWRDEILILGGANFHQECYSYHVLKQQYRYICSFPPNVILYSHSIVACPTFFNDSSTSSSSSKTNTVTLISFGGFSSAFLGYHTLMMKYQSVWNSIPTTISDSDTSSISNRHHNEWIPLPNGNALTNLRYSDFRGARALIGGSRHHLLFVAWSCNIAVFNLQPFELLENVKNQELSFSIAFGGFLPIHDNEFIFIVEENTILIRYNEDNKEFSYETLAIFPSLKSCYQFSCTYTDHHIFIFGGLYFKRPEYSREIFIFDIKEKTWSKPKYNLILPLGIRSFATVLNQYDSSIHIIGGESEKEKSLDTHFRIMVNIGWGKENMKKILQYWIRISKLQKNGWIKEFNGIIETYLKPIRYCF